MILRFFCVLVSLSSVALLTTAQPAEKNSASDTSLIPNPSFERYQKLPSEENQFYGYVQAWVVNEAKQRSHAKIPSFLHQHQYSREETVSPHSGYGMASLEFGWDSGERSFLQTKLQKPLTPGKRYRFSFWVLLDNTAICQDVFPELGFLFTPDEINPDTNSMLPSKPHWHMMHPLETNRWQQVQVAFTPQLPYQYLAVGSFVDISEIAPAKRKTCSRILVDDFELTEEANLNDFNFFATISVPGGNLGGVFSTDRPDLLAAPREDVRAMPAHRMPGRPGIFKLLGQVIDVATRKPIPNAKIIVLAQPQDSVIAETKSETELEAEGSFKLSFPKYKPGATYYVIASKTNYYFADTAITPADTASDEEVSHLLALKRLNKDSPIELKNVHFRSNEAVLLPASFPELDKLVWLLQDKPKTTVLVSGHTDNTGNEKANMILSEKRAQAVVEYLKTKGIPEKNLQFKGLGETKPIASNETPEGRTKNRRVEIVLSMNSKQ